MEVNYRHNTFSQCNCISQGRREDRLGFYIQDEWLLASLTCHRGSVRSSTSARSIPLCLVSTLYQRSNILRASRVACVRGFRSYIPNQCIHGVQTANLIEYSATFVPLQTTIAPPSNSTTTSTVGSRNLSPERIIRTVGYQGWYLQHRLRIRADLYL